MQWLADMPLCVWGNHAGAGQAAQTRAGEPGVEGERLRPAAPQRRQGPLLRPTWYQYNLLFTHSLTRS
jgi:hypothetical protein